MKWKLKEFNIQKFWEIVLLWGSQQYLLPDSFVKSEYDLEAFK